MRDIQQEATKRGYTTLSIVGRRHPFKELPCIKVGSPLSFWTHVALTTLFDLHGFGSYFKTKKILSILRKEQPDIIHLHNLHGYYLNLPLLFRYLSSEYQGQLYWTLHDCWAFTGHCAYFTMAECDKWKTLCSHCPCKTNYPISCFLDRSKTNFLQKKDLICSVKSMQLLTPSDWMSRLISQSFLADFPVKVIPNGIDLEVFSYNKDSALYTKFQLSQNLTYLIGVANVWDKRKGLQDFLSLAQILPKQYHIILVGLNKHQINTLPTNITGILRTEDQKELAGLYSLSSIFINPSLEESFSLVTVEAFACGTPVIALDTSAVKELVTKENGIVLHSHRPEDYLHAIQKLEKALDLGIMTRETISNTAKKYDQKQNISKIVDLYQETDDSAKL